MAVGQCVLDLVFLYERLRLQAHTCTDTSKDRHNIAAITEGKDDEASSENPTQTEPKG